MKDANKAHVNLNINEDDDEMEPDGKTEEEGTAEFVEENNFKLVTGSAHLKVTEPPRDELFGLTFRRALKVYRRVEYLEEYLEEEWPEPKDEDDEIKEPIWVTRKRWIEVQRLGEKIKINLEPEYVEENEAQLLNLFDVDHKTGEISYRAPFKSEWFSANAASLNDNLKLNEDQMNRLGSMELIEFTD